MSSQPQTPTENRTGRAAVPTLCYLICATPRCGSTLLCDALEATGVAGRPHEYFEELKETGVPRRPREYFWGLRSPDVLRLLPPDSQLNRRSEQRPSWDRDDYARHLAASFEQGTTPNRVFGAKLMWSYFRDFIELMRGIPRFAGMDDGSLLNAAFPGLRFVFVSRSDKARQAVSLWRALQTWVWREQERSAGEPPPTAQTIAQRSVYSFDAIDHLLDQLRRQEDAWRGFFFRIGQQPLQLFYEDIAGDLEGSVGRVLEALRVERPAGTATSPSRSRRQSDELSESWVQSYLEDVSRR